MAPCGEPVRLFVTVGSQLPFDRMVSAVAAWVRVRPSVQAIAQIGASRLDGHTLAPMACVDHLAPLRYAHHIDAAQLIVAHAGMGSILTAIETHKPLIVMPRRGHLHETRNDHQFDTAMHLLEHRCSGETPLIRVALNESALPAVLDQVLHDLTEGAYDQAHDPVQPQSASHIALVRSLRQAIRGLPVD